MDIQLFGSNEEFIALATNSVSVKVYSLADFDRYQLLSSYETAACSRLDAVVYFDKVIGACFRRSFNFANMLGARG